MSLTPPNAPQDEERAALVVVIRVAHKALTRYCHGDLNALANLTPQVLAWLEMHEYIAAVPDESGQLHYDATPKGRRAVA